MTEQRNPDQNTAMLTKPESRSQAQNNQKNLNHKFLIVRDVEMIYVSLMDFYSYKFL